VRRYDTELSLVVFDLDRFKDFNDRHGHAAGNLLLSGVGRASCARHAAPISPPASAARS